MIEIMIALAFGIVIGREWRSAKDNAKYSKTYEQLDEQLRKELAYHKNLNESLMSDIRFLRGKHEDS
jgi:hypothetical protein